MHSWVRCVRAIVGFKKHWILGCKARVLGQGVLRDVYEKSAVEWGFQTHTKPRPWTMLLRISVAGLAEEPNSPP